MALEREYNQLLKKIALNIKEVRNQKGLTQEQMADLGFNYRHYQKIESGTYSFNLYTLFRLSQIFEVKVQRFFD